MASLACGHEAAAGSGNPRLCRPSIYLAPSQLRLRTLSSPRLHRHPSHPSSKAAPLGSASWAVTTLLEGTALRLTPPRPVRLARLYLQHIKQRPEGQPPPPPHRIAWPSGRGLTAQETEAQRKPVQVGEPKLKPRPRLRRPHPTHPLQVTDASPKGGHSPGGFTRGNRWIRFTEIRPISNPGLSPKVRCD